MVTADLVILTIRSGTLMVLLVKRDNEPFKGRFALPGGFLRDQETIEKAAARELSEETGVRAESLHLEQVRLYSDPRRDPRRPRVLTCAFLAIAPDLGDPVPGTDAQDALWSPVDAVLAGTHDLAFDHDTILADAVEQARAKLEYSTIATAFCQPQFTIGELREVYEAVWGVDVDRPNFHRKVTGSPGFVVPTGSKRQQPNGRPATLYTPGAAEVLSPPMLRTPRTRARPLSGADA